jgi:hypothetical protein
VFPLALLVLASPPKPVIELAAVMPPLEARTEPVSLTPHWTASSQPDYEAAWQKIRNGDRQAVDALGAIARTAHGPLARAALLDVVNLIADSEIHQSAVSHLARLHLDATPSLDLLAALYLEHGQHDDAWAVGALALRDEKRGVVPRSCERRVAWTTLGDLDVSELRGDTPCSRRVSALACANTRAQVSVGVGARLVATRECFNELPDDPDRDAKLLVVIAYNDWDHAVTVTQFADIARELEPALAVPGAENLAVTALEVAEGTCTGTALDDVTAVAKRLRAAAGHDQRFDQRLQKLAAAAVKACRT